MMSDQGGVRFYSGTIAAPPADWKAQSAPAPEKGKFVPNVNIALTADPMGKPLIGYWVQPEEGQNYRVLLWSPESGQTVTAAIPTTKYRMALTCAWQSAEPKRISC
jgi:hypothetical protein